VVYRPLGFPFLALVVRVVAAAPMGGRKAALNHKARAGRPVRPRKVFSRVQVAAADLPALPGAVRAPKVGLRVAAVLLVVSPAVFQELRVVARREAVCLAEFQVLAGRAVPVPVLAVGGVAR
jgi:hypothetical protein